jgi:hypothetical protein
VIVTRGEAVWDVSIFRYLLQRYPAFEVSRVGQEMMEVIISHGFKYHVALFDMIFVQYLSSK